jgi:hypothetical protein
VYQNIATGIIKVLRVDGKKVDSEKTIIENIRVSGPANKNGLLTVLPVGQTIVGNFGKFYIQGKTACNYYSDKSKTHSTLYNGKVTVYATDTEPEKEV